MAAAPAGRRVIDTVCSSGMNGVVRSGTELEVVPKGCPGRPAAMNQRCWLEPAFASGGAGARRGRMWQIGLTRLSVDSIEVNLPPGRSSASELPGAGPETVTRDGDDVGP